MKITYSKKLYCKAQLKWWGILIVMLGILFIAIVNLISDKIKFDSKTVEQLTIFLIGFVAYPAYAAIMRRLDKINDKILKDAASAKLGFDGENIVNEWLEDNLPKDKYTILRNVTIPDHIFDIDFVIICPKGIIILEVKNYTSRVKFSDDKYFLIQGNREIILPHEEDPREEIRRHTEYLRQYLGGSGLNSVRTLKAVVFPRNNAADVSGSSGVWIASGFDSLRKFFDGASEDATYTQELQDKIKKLLV